MYILLAVLLLVTPTLEDCEWETEKKFICDNEQVSVVKGPALMAAARFIVVEGDGIVVISTSTENEFDQTSYALVGTENRLYKTKAEKIKQGETKNIPYEWVAISFGENMMDDVTRSEKLKIKLKKTVLDISPIANQIREFTTTEI